MLEQIKNKINNKRKMFILLTVAVSSIIVSALLTLNNQQNYPSQESDILSASNPSFSNLSAEVTVDKAVFNFTHNGSSPFYQIDLSTYADMSWDTYLNFAPGTTSPIVVNLPTDKWEKYKCGTTLYWRVLTSHREESSQIQSVSLSCASTPTPTPIPVTTLPTVKITYPINLDRLSNYQAISIEASATNTIKVEFWINNQLICTDNASPYSCSWSGITPAKYSYYIEAKAYNSVGQTASHKIGVFRK